MCVSARTHTLHVDMQHLLLHSGSEAYRSAPGFDGDEKCWQERVQPQDQLAGLGWAVITVTGFSEPNIQAHLCSRVQAVSLRASPTC